MIRDDFAANEIVMTSVDQPIGIPQRRHDGRQPMSLN